MIKKFTASSLLVSFIIFGALPVAMAQTTTPTNITAATTTAVVKSQARVINIACVKNAIDARDGALISAVDAYAASAKSALSTRRLALKSAWDLTGKEQRKALLTAWRDYRNALRKAKKDIQQARQNIWKDFYASRKSCNAFGEEPGGGQGADAQL